MDLFTLYITGGFGPQGGSFSLTRGLMKFLCIFYYEVLILEMDLFSSGTFTKVFILLQ